MPDLAPCGERGSERCCSETRQGPSGSFLWIVSLRLGEPLRSSKDKDQVKWLSKNVALDLSQLRGSFLHKRVKPTKHINVSCLLR